MTTLAEALAEYRRNPLMFVYDIWGLVPQEPKPEFKETVKNSKPEELKPEYFGDFDGEKWAWYNFEKKKHITWQQYAILKAVRRAINKEAPMRISIRSGHGIGKTSCISWIVYWALFCFENSQVPCTAPTADQLFDVLWKELSKWKSEMRAVDVQGMFDIKRDKVEVKGHDKSWFARGRTAHKEKPEALAGVHSESLVCAIADEASGIADEIFLTGEGAMTGENNIFIMISNPTRVQGYFYESHTTDSHRFQNLHFSSLDSPIVNWQFVRDIAEKHGSDGVEYKIRVKGEFPEEDAIDKKGYMQLIPENIVEYCNLQPFHEKKRLGVDPSGEGKDKTSWVLRDNFRAYIVHEEAISSPRGIAMKTIQIMDREGLKGEHVFIDNYGEGANVAQEIALTNGQRVNAVNVGDKAEENTIFINRRAEISWRAKEWLKNGGELVRDKRWKEAHVIKFRRNIQGRIQIMPKVEMLRDGVKSPNHWDALTLTFWDPIVEGKSHVEMERENIRIQRDLSGINLLDAF